MRVRCVVVSNETDTIVQRQIVQCAAATPERLSQIPRLYSAFPNVIRYARAIGLPRTATSARMHIIQGATIRNYIF